MNAHPIVVVDYGAGNLTSVEHVLRYLGAPFLTTARPEDLRDAEGVIFPGVGEAASSMAELSRTGLDEALKRFVASGRKVLGICIGCQVIFDRSEERDTPCLGIVGGVVRRFPRSNGLKVPHMGWNAVHVDQPHPLLEGIPQDSAFYFVHSFYPEPVDPGMVVATTDYGFPFASVVAAGNLAACQFHVEKSGAAGLALISNFLAWDGRWEGPCSPGD